MAVTKFNKPLDEEVKELSEHITQMQYTKRGTNVALKNYSASTLYTCQSDGFVVISARGADGVSFVHICDREGSEIGYKQLHGTSAAETFRDIIYIKKGLKLYGEVTGSSSANDASFYPLEP